MRKETVRAAAAVVILIIAAMVCRKIHTENEYINTLAGMTRSFLYIALYIMWTISLHHRIINRHLHRYALILGGTMVFWFLLRTVKYMFIYDAATARYLWYGFYIPLAVMPLTLLFIAVFLGRPERYKLPKPLKLLSIFAVLLAAAVLTNDLHQLVFIFPEGKPWTDFDFRHGPLYWVWFAYITSCGLAALITMLKRYRAPSGRWLWLPFVPFAAAFCYSVLYILQFPPLYAVAGDFTAFLCLFSAFLVESCLRCGLIQSNHDYDEMFRISTLGAQITDVNHKVKYASQEAAALPQKILSRASSEEIILANGVKLSAAPIAEAGYILWQENISELLAILGELEDNKKALEDSNVLRQETYKRQAQSRHLAEKSRLYDIVEAKTERELGILRDLLRQFKAAESDAEKMRILRKVTIIGGYFKRHANLIFMGEQKQDIAGKELERCFNESFQHLSYQRNIEYSKSVQLRNRIPTAAAITIYELFETVIEGIADSVSAVFFRVYERERDFVLAAEAECGGEVMQLNSTALTVEPQAEGIWKITGAVAKGGSGR